jgi:hypothetical protein
MQNCTNEYIETYELPRIVSMDWVKSHNSHLVNPGLMLPGQNIVLLEFRKNKE